MYMYLTDLGYNNTISGIKLSINTSWYGFDAPMVKSTATRPFSAVSALTTPNFFNSIFIIFRLDSESTTSSQVIVKQTHTYIR